MNTLTKNRILQSGDEYSHNGQWKPVPQADFGLQIMFTKYQQVRRPSEEPSKILPENHEQNATRKSQCAAIGNKGNLNAAPVLAEPNMLHNESIGEAKGESLERESITTKPAVAQNTDSRGGVQLPVIVKGVPIHPDSVAKIKNLPTVVSTKAHTTPAPYAPKPTTVDSIQIDFPDPDSPPCDWTGRNGTFKGRAIYLNKLQPITGNVIQISPVGQRGIGNCLIEFPAAIIPQLTDWLLRHQQPTKTNGT
jgi:hypothetical protein